MIIDLDTLQPAIRQNYLQYAIAPRPICFASTVDASGNVNLSPFSFFNMFSSTPPIVVFSPARRVRDNTTKHTLDNVLEVPEVVINIVDLAMVQQVSLASTEYAKGVNEFIKSGLHPEPATLIRPPMVQESRIKMECRVNEVKALGSGAGAGNLVICEVLRMHIDESILDEQGMIDQTRIEHIARLGGDWYCSVNSSNLFRVEKPLRNIGIGVDALPDSIRNSEILTGNHLGQLGNVAALPEFDPAFDEPRLTRIVQYFAHSPAEMEKEVHRLAAELLKNNQVSDAWQVLLSTV